MFTLPRRGMQGFLPLTTLVLLVAICSAWGRAAQAGEGQPEPIHFKSEAASKDIFETLPAGNVLSVESLLVEPGQKISLPVLLFRRTDAQGAPAALNADLLYDPAVLAPIPNPLAGIGGGFQSPFLVDHSLIALAWYDKDIVANEIETGRLRYVVSGLNQYEITTFDDQRSGGDPNDQVNPFPMGSVLFEVIGDVGDSTAFDTVEFVLADRDANQVMDAGAILGKVTVVEDASELAPDRVNPFLDFSFTETEGAQGTTVEVEVWLTRGPEATKSPAVISGVLQFDSQVIQAAVDPGGQDISSARLQDWYGKSFQVTPVAPGEIAFEISDAALSGLEITTLDDQRPPQDRTGGSSNPFLLGRIPFDVVGGLGATSPLAVMGLNMDTAAGEAIRTARGLWGQFSVGAAPTPVLPREVFVSSGLGSDGAGSGQADDAWQTISHAVAQAAPQATAERPITINVAAGVYDERVELQPHVRLRGAGPGATVIRYFDPSADTNIVVRGAENSAISQCTITLPPEAFDTSHTMLDIRNVSMEVRDVEIDGKGMLPSFGILVSGRDSSASRVTDSTIRNVQFGIQAVNSGVTLARNVIEDVLSIGMIVRRPSDTKESEVIAPLLGDSQQLTTSGFNTFRDMEGLMVQNLGSIPIQAEMNLWDVEDLDGDGVISEEEIRQQLSGEIDIDPWIGKGLGPGSLVALVLNKSTSKAITDTPVTVKVEGQAEATAPVTAEPIIFDTIPSGRHTVSAEAQGYVGQARSISVDPLAVTSTVLHLAPVRAAETPGPTVRGDINGNGRVDAVDVQLVINAALGIDIGEGMNADINGDNVVNAVDVQLVINAALGIDIG